MGFKHVLGLAGVSDETEAMRQAGQIARQHNAHLTFLCLAPQSDIVNEAPSTELLMAHIAEVTGLEERDFQLVVDTDKVDRALIATAKMFDCDLIVIPASAPCEKLLRHLDSAIFVAREDEGKGVLAATDLSDPSFPALSAGQEAAQMAGEELTGMFSLSFAVPVSYGLGAELTTYGFSEGAMEEMTTTARTELRQAMRSLDAKGDVLVEMGPAAAAILRTASRLHSHLIVVGSHRKSFLPRLLLGSVSESVARYAPCSVLVTGPHETRAPEAA